MSAPDPTTFGRVELAIIERLKAVSKLGVLGYHLRTVETLPIDVDDKLKNYVGQLPAAWTVFGGWRTLSQNRVGSLVEARFSVVVAAQNQRGEPASRLGGGPGEVGSYQMLNDVVRLLVGSSLGLDIAALELGPSSVLYSGPILGELKASILAASFTTRLTITPWSPDQLAAQDVGDFAELAADWRQPPSETELQTLTTLPIQEPST